MSDVFICCEDMESAIDSRVFGFYVEDQATPHLLDSHGLLYDPIRFCPFCGTKIKPSIEANGGAESTGHS